MHYPPFIIRKTELFNINDHDDFKTRKGYHNCLLHHVSVNWRTGGHYAIHICFTYFPWSIKIVISHRIHYTHMEECVLILMSVFVHEDEVATINPSAILLRCM